MEIIILMVLSIVACLVILIVFSSFTVGRMSDEESEKLLKHIRENSGHDQENL